MQILSRTLSGIRLLRSYWHEAIMVDRVSGYMYYGDPFKVGRGVTQGGHCPPTLFNVVVDAVVRHWLSIVCEDAMDEGFGPECHRGPHAPSATPT